MILDSFRLDGRVALVTGANRGLGQAYAVALAEAGADAALLGRTDPDETTERVKATGRRVAYLPYDLATAVPAELTAAVDRVRAEFGHLDILVNNAGIIRRAPAAEASAADWDDVLTVNLDAVFHLSQAAGRVMLAQGGGRIINVASMLSFQGGIRVPAYTAAKHGVLGLTRSLAIEVARRGVTVNAVCPGYTDTEFVERAVAQIRAKTGRSTEEARAELVRVNPQGRLVRPQEVALVVLWLCQHDAASVTGQAIAVAGGEVM
jgi:2-dehydro-3-deoxy-D-gluconate 5-dehydrogenase